MRLVKHGKLRYCCYKLILKNTTKLTYYMSNLYITVTLGKWPSDRYVQGDRCTQASFKLPPEVNKKRFYVQLSLNLRFIDKNEQQQRNKHDKKANKMSVIYFSFKSEFVHQGIP